MHHLNVFKVTMGLMTLSLLFGCVSTSTSMSGDLPELGDWKSVFDLSPDDLTTTGRNPFFILEPGFQLILEGGGERVTLTVLNETVTIGPFTARVLEEREEKNGALREISYNFYAISQKTNDVFYLGEGVDIYENGAIVNHTGAWRAYQDDAQPGLIMPGKPVIGFKYYQEVAPGKAMDRAEVLGLDERLSTPAGIFQNCLKTLETTPLNPLEKGYKTYAPGIGLIQDENLLLIAYGFIDLED